MTIHIFQVLECLKNTKEPLSDRCQKQMFKIHTQDMIDNSVDYTLVTMCHDMIKQFCENTEPSRILDCLKVRLIFAKNLNTILTMFNSKHFSRLR